MLSDSYTVNTHGQPSCGVDHNLKLFILGSFLKCLDTAYHLLLGFSAEHRVTQHSSPLSSAVRPSVHQSSYTLMTDGFRTAKCTQTQWMPARNNPTDLQWRHHNTDWMPSHVTVTATTSVNFSCMCEDVDINMPVFTNPSANLAPEN